MAIETASGLTGFLDPLETLHEVLTDERQQAKVFDLSSEFGGWRRCKGDGNCFYRACGFAVVEALLSKNPKRLSPMAAELRRSAAVEAQDLIAMLLELPHLDSEIGLETWYQALLISKDMDEQLVRALRMVASGWLADNEATDFSGMPIAAFVRETTGMDLETFRHLEVLANGKEAELLMIHATCAALDLHIEVIQLDRTPGSAQRYYLPQDRHGEPAATLLFRPGHYDIFYRRKLFQELSALEEALNLRKSCREVKRGIERPQTPAAGSSFGRQQEASPSSGGIARGSPLRGASRGSDSFEDAMDTLRQALRDSARHCAAAIDREAVKFAQEVDKLEEDRATRRRLEEEIRILSDQLALKREALREEEDIVSRLQAAGGVWACCLCPPQLPDRLVDEGDRAS